ncbi:hypothetical protein K9N50_08550 [bacterium]|nr:hypothetical protein [bacterium]
MGNSIDRLKASRAMFARGSRQQLAELIGRYDPRIIVKLIERSIELQIVTEDIALLNGLKISDEMMTEYSERNRENINKSVDRALMKFISSIVSHEG